MTTPIPSERIRTSLPSAKGKVRLHGHPKAAALLQQALDFSETSDQALRQQLLHVHLFHSYTARTHPLTLRTLLQQVQPGQVVLDPFVGSGTTLVEAALRGALGVGTDVSPLAVRLARFKATPMPAALRDVLQKTTQQLAQNSLARVQKRIRPSATWDQPQHYAPHVYLELCGLRQEIEKIKSQDKPVYEACLLVFSSLVTKASQQASDSSQLQKPKSLAKGQISNWFLQKSHEMLVLHERFATLVPARTPKPQIQQADSRLHEWDLPVDIVITSPPYLGVYDYAFHQERRSAWLELNTHTMQHQEMASRRSAQLPAALTQHQQDTLVWMHLASKPLKKKGFFFVLVGDSDLAGMRIFGDQPLVQAASQIGLTLFAACAVERPNPKPNAHPAGIARWEHVLQFVKD